MFAAIVLLLSIAPAALASGQESAQLTRTPEERSLATEAEEINALEVVETFEEVSALSDHRPPGKPRNDVIEDVPVNPNDASIPLNLIPYHDFPPRLRALQASDRISVEIAGQSANGHNIYLAVATAPMSDAEWAEWQRLSDLRIDDPIAAIAAMERGEYDNWRQPLFINGNIHGNEWEGADSNFQVLERLATANDEETLRWLNQHILVFVVSLNPDGRILGQRPNGNGFDLNRDHITGSQPESRVIREQMVRYSPMTMLDLHGYVNCTLIEPTTGPHGIDYEYDLYIYHAIRNALAMEAAIIATGEERATCSDGQGGRRADIPWRNRTTGWDDWPPIFTPMYAMYHGAIGHTVEIPLNPRGNLPVEERHERTRINTLVARKATEANFAYANANRMRLLADQLEMFRRGVAGEDSRPIDDPLALSLAAGDNADTLPQSYPDAYVIPVGVKQRSKTAAARLAQFLIDNDVAVHQATEDFTLGGQTYEAGSYVVNMHQAKRGLANTIIDTGRDVSPLFPTMYDISAWSNGRLWGANTVRVETADLSGLPLERISAASPTGGAQSGRALYALTVDSANGVRAVNHLLRAGVELTRLPDGRFVVRGTEFAAIQEAASLYGVSFENLPHNQNKHAQPFNVLNIGVSGASDEVFALASMGYELTSVNHTGFNNGTYSFDDFDALYVSSTAFNPLNLNAEQQDAFAKWLLAGGSVVLRGSSGFTFNTRANLLQGIGQRAGAGDANGITAVVNNPDSPITGDAISYAFVSSPRTWDVPADSRIRVDQRFEDEGFFLAGHWRGSGNSTQAAAAGRPTVISGKARGANVTLFGTEPLYRSHPEGMFTQVAEALWQADICAPDFDLLEGALADLAAAGGITAGLEAKIRNAFEQTELWLTLEQQRPIAHTHLERAIHLLLWQADVIETKNKPNQGDPDGLRALAATIQTMLEDCL